jgi:hypothetical protein
MLSDSRNGVNRIKNQFKCAVKQFTMAYRD